MYVTLIFKVHFVLHVSHHINLFSLLFFVVTDFKMNEQLRSYGGGGRWG